MANFEIQVIAGEERQTLRRFVEETMLFLRELSKLENTALGEILFYPEPLYYCSVSLSEFRPYEQTALNAVEDISVLHIEAHALEGIHLKSKLGIIAFYHRQVSELLRAPNEPNVVERARTSKPNRILRKVLESIDTLLESLFDGLPGGGAVVELKKQFETAVKD